MKYYFFPLFFILIFFCSCEKKIKTQSTNSTTTSPETNTSNISIGNLMRKETQAAEPDLAFIKKFIDEAESNVPTDEKSEREKAAINLLAMASDLYTNGNYNRCISNAAQIPLSNPLFSPAQYLVGYSFFHTQAYERAVEIFKGISQNQDFFKDMNRTEAGWMHILGQYNFYKKTNDKFQKDKLKSAIEYFLSKDENRNSIYFTKVERLKNELNSVIKKPQD